MTQPILLRGGHVIDPSRDLDQAADVLIQDGKIAGVGRGLAAPDGAIVRNVKGNVVTPGLVDLHVHLREPGNEDEETVASGARAAAAGMPFRPSRVATRPSCITPPAASIGSSQ